MTVPVKSTRINGVQYNYPMCHLCHVQVQAFSWCDHQDDAARMPALTIVGDDAPAPVMRTFFALCHGETDTVSIPLEELSKGQGVGVGEAFLPRDPVPYDSRPRVPRLGGVHTEPFWLAPPRSPSPPGLPPAQDCDDE